MDCPHCPEVNKTLRRRWRTLAPRGSDGLSSVCRLCWCICSIRRAGGGANTTWTQPNRDVPEEMLAAYRLGGLGAAEDCYRRLAGEA